MSNGLNKWMGNETASTLGDIVKEAYESVYGDMIDLGLILRRLLEEKGYKIVAAEYDKKKNLIK